MQPSGGETTWTNTGATRYGKGQHKTGSIGDDMLRHSPNHGTQRLPNDDDDEFSFIIMGHLEPRFNQPHQPWINMPHHMHPHINTRAAKQDELV